MFFVLSGFIVPYSMARAGYRVLDFPRFVLKRITRIDPPYLVTIALVLFLQYLSSLSPLFRGERLRMDWVQLFAHVGYLAPFFQKWWYSPVFWTLAVEFQYYLVLAAMFPVLFSNKALLRLGAVLGLLALGSIIPAGQTVAWYFPIFLAGIVLCQSRICDLLRSELLMYPLLVFGVLFARFGWPPTVVAVFTCLMITFVKTCPMFLCSLGDISYSLYLLHWPLGTRVMNFGNRFAHGEFQFDLLLLAGLAISLVSAWLMYRWVELPAKNLASRIKYKVRGTSVENDAAFIRSY
jgi:peptidoglycan/LPS O-acetylase OafA/YrhL